MKIRVEPPRAVRESYSGSGLGSHSSRDECSLPFVMQSQELTRWCWAAIAASLGRYYGCRLQRQHEVASLVLGFDCSGFRETAEIEARCDVYALLDEALRHTGCFGHWSPGRPTFERLRGEIDAGRPVCVQVDWHRGGSHFTTISGYHKDEIYIQDPVKGPSIHPFESFPGCCRTAPGVWNGTFWTRPPTIESRAERRISKEP